MDNTSLKSSEVESGGTITYLRIDKDDPELEVALDRAAELFWITTQQKLPWAGDSPTYFGDQKVTPSRFNHVLAQYLTNVIGKSIEPESVAAMIKKIQERRPDAVQTASLKLLPDIGNEKYIKFGDIRGKRNSELLAESPMVKPGENDIQSKLFYNRIAQSFVRHIPATK